ncbi:hypothetical protein [Acinetobacter chinensis]|uniref:hypothetical protein n=1 Tax=Acinetobacter chinensis TaxID=2004650 RepID=UPI0029343893|nr:hypothetical protein [Acinetobacter chinensis]WOE42497.1 hypothetical protein QSG87_05015 [Acinetobacter chinensis]
MKPITIYSALLTCLSFSSYSLAQNTDTNPADLYTENTASRHTESINNTNDEIFDLFTGTVSFKNSQIVLHRCSLTADDYVLNFIDPAQKQKVKKLLSSGDKFWITVLGSFSEKNAEYHLKVSEVTDIKTGSSCHLKDLLGE